MCSLIFVRHERRDPLSVMVDQGRLENGALLTSRIGPTDDDDTLTSVARRRSLKEILHNFLCAFASRSSDYGGYWIFGMLVRNTDGHRVNLLGSELAADDVLAAAGVIARQRFQHQLAKSELGRSDLREAWLEIQRSPRSATVFVNGLAATGYELIFTARAVSNLGGTCERAHSIFVAPHDAGVEQRSARAGRLP